MDSFGIVVPGGAFRDIVGFLLLFFECGKGLTCFLSLVVPLKVILDIFDKCFQGEGFLVDLTFFKSSSPMEVNLEGRLNSTQIAITESSSSDRVVVLSSMMEHSSRQLSEMEFSVDSRLLAEMMVQNIWFR